MSLQKDSDFLPASNEVVLDNETLPSAEITQSSDCVEPLKILVFPPKNKQFRFDEETSSFEIKPIGEQTVSNNGEVDVNFASNSPCAQNETTLTPLVEKCSFLKDSVVPNYESTPLRESELETCKTNLVLNPILKIKRVFDESRLGKECFLKGCKWSGDGLCLLSNSEDNVLRLFEFSEYLLSNPQDDIKPVLQMREGGTVYDYVWYPLMNSLDPISCVFACTSQGAPIHLWDAFTGDIRATYQPINQYDEVTSAYSLAFSPDGTKLYSGFKKCLRIFDISQPGRISEERNLKVKGNPVFQSNIISSICVNPCMPALYALGSYDKTIGIYSEPEGDLIFILSGHSGGITQITFSADGQYLYSGGRNDSEILCWDLRNPGKVVYSLKRKVETQQKIQFDLSLDQSYLITGSTDCHVRIFDVKNASGSDNMICCLKAHDDCVNGVQFHPNLPIFASSSGQRHLPETYEEEGDLDHQKNINADNSIKIWTFGKSQSESDNPLCEN